MASSTSTRILALVCVRKNSYTAQLLRLLKANQQIRPDRQGQVIMLEEKPGLTMRRHISKDGWDVFAAFSILSRSCIDRISTFFLSLTILIWRVTYSMDRIFHLQSVELKKLSYPRNDDNILVEQKKLLRNGFEILEIGEE